MVLGANASDPFDVIDKHRTHPSLPSLKKIERHFSKNHKFFLKKRVFTLMASTQSCIESAVVYTTNATTIIQPLRSLISIGRAN